MKYLILLSLLCSTAYSAEYNVSPPCNQTPVFSVGGQYVDSDNGVEEGVYSTLMRWQGNNPLNNYSTTQQGYYNTYHNCNSGSMLLNSWTTPRFNVLGGGYNNMYGYKYVKGTEPSAFTFSRFLTPLIISAELAVPYVNAQKYSTTPSIVPVGQAALYVYLRDISNPHLHPIALVSLTHETRSYEATQGVSCDYKDGVYFAYGDNNSGEYFAYDSKGVQGHITTGDYFENVNQPLLQHRMKITPKNFLNTLSKINSGIANCPQDGYSTNLRNYVVEYYGVIMETTIHDGKLDNILYDTTKDNITMVVNHSNLSIIKEIQQIGYARPTIAF